ncbi:MAG: alpha/beta hydrolase [Dehalococcoidia bacterium]
METVAFWSEGTKLAADIYRPEGEGASRPRPAIVLCHGWGGTKDEPALKRHAETFARAGFVSFALDYRGWGESEGKVVARSSIPRERAEVTASVQVIRELVDPFDEFWDVRRALDYLEGEPGVDSSRIGLWGSSLGGGLVVAVAAADRRVRCVVSQVAAQDTRGIGGESTGDQVRKLAIAEARGAAESIPQSGGMPGLQGVPHLSKLRFWAPIEEAERLEVPVLLIDAEHEELMDRHQNSELLHKRLVAAGKAETVYHVLQGASHYEAYGERWQETSDLALGWFRRHLMGGQQPS